MEIKGTAVKSIQEFVKNNFTDDYKKWLDTLPENSNKIMMGGVFANNWYSMKDAAIEPTKNIAKLFYSNDIKKAAHISGRYSAEVGLKGVYKIFVRIAKPHYIIQRAGRIFTSYYSPSEMEVVDIRDKGVTLHITKFPEPDVVIENRIAGWMEQALELTSCKNVKVRITKSMTNGDAITEIDINWV